ILWEIGAAQTDAATLRAEDVDWNAVSLIYQRSILRKDSEPCVLRIGHKLAAILKLLPQSGPLFPRLVLEGSNHRAPSVVTFLSLTVFCSVDQSVFG
ncbi:MAG: hypothetical protein ABIP85_12500, partial [Chthoniobacteraceae bacterium]